MSLIARDNGGGGSPIEEGTHVAVCSALVDLGIQPQVNEKFKETPKVLITFSVTDETYTNKDGEEIPKSISKTYTNSLNSKSSLYKDLSAWRGKKFTAQELSGFDLKNIVGVPCQISITHTEKEGKKYPNISGVTGIPKGMKIESEIETIIFDLEEAATYDNFSKLPDWIQQRITECINLEKTDFHEFYSKIDFQEIDDEELPF